MLNKLILAISFGCLQLTACAGDRVMLSETNFINNEHGSVVFFGDGTKSSSIGLSRKPDLLTAKTSDTKFAIKWDVVCYFSYTGTAEGGGQFTLARRDNGDCKEISFGNISKSTWDKLNELYGRDIVFKTL
jgi:hypothetical protein